MREWAETPLSLFNLCMSEHTPLRHFEHQTRVTRDAEGRPKVRDIFVPDDEAREAHAGMLWFLQDSGFINPALLHGDAWTSGGMPGAQALDGVLPHKDNWTYYKLDIKNAFPSVDIDVLRARLLDRSHALGRGAGVRAYLEYFMDTFATVGGLDQHEPLIIGGNEITGLPQGAPCSPYLFNFYCQDMDIELSQFCERRGLTYTRYLDDITISSIKPNDTLGADTRRMIRNIIESNPGMKINHSKSRLLRRAEHHIEITGVAIYPDGRIQPRPKLIEKTLGAFAAIADEVHSGQVITPSHLGIVDGYHSVLTSLSVGPHNEMMRESFETYRTLARVVRAAMIMADEPVRQVASAEKVKQIEATLIAAMYNDESAASELVISYPEVYDVLSENGLIDIPLPPQMY
jgi:Reverse transcriptase (RNA-dependent DNA polymerase)